MNKEFYKKARSLGKPIQGIEIKVEKMAGKISGLIFAKGDVLMNGYY